MSCSSVALLLLVAFTLSTTPSPAAGQFAATALGDIQGVPAGWTGQQYPMPTDCYDDQISSPNRHGDFPNLPSCSVSDTIGIFSAHLQGVNSGTSVLIDPVSSSGGSFGGCGTDTIEQGGCKTYGTHTVGSAVFGTPGDPVSLEWSCQPSQRITYTSCSFGMFGTCFDRHTHTYTLSYSSSVSAVGFSASGLSGTATIPFSSAAKTVTLQCDTYPPMNITLDPNAAPPAVSITGNGRNPIQVQAGTQVNITATFTPAAGDTLLKSAINDYAQQALTSQAAASSKTYVFTPRVPGTYIFYPAVQTQKFPSWNDYGKSLTVTVGGCSGSTSDTENGCPSQCTGAHQVGVEPNCSCEPGFTMQGGACVAVQCGPHQAGPTCSCVPGYQQVDTGAACTPIPPAVSISASRYQVRQGTPATINWNVTGLISGAGQGCAITSTPNVLSLSMPAGTNPVWSGSQDTAPIQSSTIFTLACSGTPSRSITVTEIPSVIEI